MSTKRRIAAAGRVEFGHGALCRFVDQADVGTIGQSYIVPQLGYFTNVKMKPRIGVPRSTSA